MNRARKQVLCTVCIWQWVTSGHVVKLPIWKGYHIILNLYWYNKYICTIEVLPPWVVPIFFLAHGLIYFLRNLRLRSVVRPDPSTRTRYWSNWRTSTPLPVVSPLSGWFPVWFCMRTVSPGGHCQRGQAMCVITQFLCRSHVSVAKCGFTCIKGVAPRAMWLVPARQDGIRSLIGRPKTHWAGDNFVVWSGVLRYINMARWNLSVSSLPLVICVVHYHSLWCLNANFCPAVTVWEGYRRKAVMYSPIS